MLSNLKMIFIHLGCYFLILRLMFLNCTTFEENTLKVNLCYDSKLIKYELVRFLNIKCIIIHICKHVVIS